MTDDYLPSPTCEFCVHCDHRFQYACTAFPDGIPAEIWLGENHHLDPVDGDHGIHFELAAGETHKPPWLE